MQDSELKELAQAIKEQAKAIDRLANATMTLVAALADQVEELDQHPLTYLDGTPIA